MSARASLTIVAALALAGIGCDRLPTGPAPASIPAVRGITLVDWTADGYATSAAAIQALAATGANTVTILVTGYQASASENVVRADDPRTPSGAAVRTAVAMARGLGLRVTIKPHVDLNDGAWRGTIAPRDVAAWFLSYRGFVLRWSALAESLGAEQFVVGTELAGTVRHEGEWRATIAAVRAAYRGRLTYAASWDEAGRIGFWRDLDLVGVDFYFPVANRKNPSRLEILAAWQPWLERLSLLHRQTGRNILLTEIGYRSVDGAGREPAAAGLAGTLDLGEQADLYWAALAATHDRPWLAGLTWWNWPADGSGGVEDRDYTPRGKPAAEELSGAWAGTRAVTWNAPSTGRRPTLIERSSPRANGRQGS